MQAYEAVRYLVGRGGRKQRHRSALSEYGRIGKENLKQM
jgi:hypothetical protein